MRFYINIVFVFLFFSTNAQVVMHGLGSNPQLIHNKQSLKDRNIQIIDTLKLPFIDDFAYDSIYPSRTHWLDQNVFINNTFGIDPPSIGVATFDVLDSAGYLYQKAGMNATICDYLTSKPINLSKILPKDSLYLSFYYQPKGNGWDQPEGMDSLVLQFKTAQREWQSIYSIPGTTLKDFKQIMLPLIDTSFLKKSFQFRFFNYASIGGMQNQEDAISNDFWHLDYVVLDTGRTITDTTHKDVSFMSYNKSLFKDYYSVPWSHYSTLDVDSVFLKFNNLDKVSRSLNNITYLLYNETERLDSISDESLPISPESVKEFKFKFADYGSGPIFPAILTDSTKFDITWYYERDISSNSAYLHNDTLHYSQNFYNYYAFDDGTAESAISLIQTESQFALKVNALKADTLRGISMFFNRYKDYGTAAESIFTLCVWEDDNGVPGDTIYTEDNHKPKYGYTSNYFSFYKFQKAVPVGKTFFIGWTNETAKVYSLGFDMNTDDHNIVFSRLEGNAWANYKNGMPMMRPVLGENFTVYSVDEIEKEIDLSVYPNPIKASINIELNLNKELPIKIYNVLGQLILETTIYRSKTIDMSAYDNGLYILQIQNKTKKILLNK